MSIELRREMQESAVADEVSAITAIVRPVLQGILYALKQEVVAEAGGYENTKLFMLSRLRRPGDGDIGICFEYAVHDALNRNDQVVLEKVSDAVRLCNLAGNSLSSILFGAEKTGSLRLIETAKELLTDDSLLLYGQPGRPAKLKRYIDAVSASLRRKSARDFLPASISGLWKTDLFTGFRDSDKWIGTTLKINRDALQGAPGLRIGIVPTREGDSDSIIKDAEKNLVICPLPYDRSFMQVFYQGWEVVVQFLNADARVPKEAFLPRPPSRQVARYLEDRRDFKVVDVLEALQPLAQPALLRTEASAATVVEANTAGPIYSTALLAPIAIQTKR